MTHPLRTLLVVLAVSAGALPVAAVPSMNLALDKGCLSCHGTPPRGKAPTIADLAARMASAKGNDAETAKLSERLREHHLFGGVPAHERLSAEEAERFVRWLVDGGH